MNRTAYIVDAIRTPIGRYGGALAEVRADDLGGLVIRALLERVPVPREKIDDVVFGCANQAGEDNRNVARMALLLAGLPVHVPGATVNRLCGSGMQAIGDGARQIIAGEADLVIAGGVEQMTRAPFVMAKPNGAWPRGETTLFDTTIGWRFINPKMKELHGTLSMGETAEAVAERENVSREAQDRLALLSQQRAGKAIAAGRFEREIVPVPLPPGKDGAPRWFRTDEHPRPDTTPEQLARLKPAFKKGGTVTAGNSSGINDGAAALLLASERAVKEYNLTPLARHVTGAACGVEPSFMGLGPIPASRLALSRAGLRVSEIDVAEINEAFAAQAVPCVEQIGLDPDKVNVNGGAIALGHPLGCSGARLVGTLVHELALRKARLGLASMCIGVGQGIATIVERV
ncbi:MAG: acetyl-CoA C-acyltransferase [Deltaproteobacteria bacterium]|nr:acetyl-CoA C-acyltransferase [Deltaproteobacteria bacterium]